MSDGKKFIGEINAIVHRASQISEEELKELGGKPSIEDITDLYHAHLPLYLDTLRSKAMNAMDTTINVAVQEYEEHLYQVWGECFFYSRFLYTLAMNMLEYASDHVRSLPDSEILEKQQEYTVMRYLQGRAAQQYLEIVTLLEHGFPDGAFARWRSLYELYVVASFVAKYGDAVAGAFINAVGDDKHYDWARVADIPYFKKKKHITFADIEKNSDCTPHLNNWHGLYKESSHTHPL